MEKAQPKFDLFVGTENVNNELFEAQIRESLNQPKYAPPTNESMVNYCKFFMKAYGEAQVKETMNRLKYDQYCAEGHRLYKTIGSCQCQVCKSNGATTTSWKCEVPTCPATCATCYVLLFGKEAEMRNGRICRANQEQGIIEYYDMESVGSQPIKYDVYFSQQPGLSNYCKQCSKNKFEKDEGKWWVRGGYVTQSNAYCNDCCLKLHGPDFVESQMIKSQAFKDIKADNLGFLPRVISTDQFLKCPEYYPHFLLKLDAEIFNVSKGGKCKVCMVAIKDLTGSYGCITDQDCMIYCESCMNKVVNKNILKNHETMAHGLRIYQEASKCPMKEAFYAKLTKQVVIPVPKCDKNHSLAQLKGKVYPETKNHTCAKCKAEKIDESQCFWNCLRCEYDLCKGCLVKQYGESVLLKAGSKLGLWNPEERTVTCAQNHNLIRTECCLTSLDGTVNCYACGKYQLEKDTYYWRCQGCNYDLCKGCFKKSQKCSEDDPNGKISRTAQKKSHFRNGFMEHLRFIQREEENPHGKKDVWGTKPTLNNYLKAGLKTGKDSALKYCIREWTSVLIKVLVEKCHESDGKVDDVAIAGLLYNQFLIASIESRYWGIKDILLLSKVATIFEDAIKMVILKTCNFNIQIPKEPCYLVSQVYDSGDLFPKFSAVFFARNKSNKFFREEMIKYAGNQAIQMSDKYIKDMEDAFKQFAMEGKPIYAQCKYGKKGDVLDGVKYVHGLRRSEMKYLEELASKPENDFKVFRGMRDTIIVSDNITQTVVAYQRIVSNVYDQVKFNEGNIIKTETFCQQDILRCKAYFNSMDKILAAIDFIKSEYPLVRIKNRMNFLGDIMINFWYGDFVAEAQLVYYIESEEDDHAAKMRNKVNHFLYEIERNPLGPLAHCVELLYKNAKERNLDFSKMFHGGEFF